MLLKEWKDNVLPVKFTGLGGETHLAQVVSIETSPPAVDPGTDHQAAERIGIVLLDGVIRAERPGKVFSVKPAAHRQHRAVDIFHVAREVPRKPIAVVCVVLD